MSPAQQDEVRKRRLAAVDPMDDVVRVELAPREFQLSATTVANWARAADRKESRAFFARRAEQ